MFERFISLFTYLLYLLFFTFYLFAEEYPARALLAIKRGLRYMSPSLWASAERIDREVDQIRILEDVTRTMDNIEMMGGMAGRPLPSAPPAYLEFGQACGRAMRVSAHATRSLNPEEVALARRTLDQANEANRRLYESFDRSEYPIYEVLTPAAASEEGYVTPNAAIFNRSTPLAGSGVNSPASIMTEDLDNGHVAAFVEFTNE